ncbi:hypothetical protein MJD09_00680 [bacterium]|nr:hypothetical protein [bacterium]
MKKSILSFVFVAISVANVCAQRPFQHRMLVDMPTAGTIERGSFEVELRMFGNGGLLSNVSVGITPRFMIGLAYGGENIIGAGGVNWNPTPGIIGAIRMIDETFGVPAIAIGFTSQGYGPYFDGVDRYEYKSRGLYAVASKNYSLFHNLGLHGGINRSFETNDNDEGINLFFGIDLSFNREFRFMIEYDLARNDNENDARFGSGEGYLNAGVQWSISDRLFLQFHMRDINRNGTSDVNREFKIGYFEYF